MIGKKEAKPGIGELHVDPKNKQEVNHVKSMLTGTNEDSFNNKVINAITHDQKKISESFPFDPNNVFTTKETAVVKDKEGKKVEIQKVTVQEKVRQAAATPHIMINDPTKAVASKHSGSVIPA